MARIDADRQRLGTELRAPQLFLVRVQVPQRKTPQIPRESEEFHGSGVLENRPRGPKRGPKPLSEGALRGYVAKRVDTPGRVTRVLPIRGVARGLRLRRGRCRRALGLGLVRGL